MRGSVSALIIFAIIPVGLGAVVAAVAFKGKNVEPHAASSSSVTTAIIKMTDTPTTTPGVLERNSLWTINTAKPQSIVINISTDRPTTTAAVDGSLTIKCDHEWHQDSTPMCTYGPGFARRDSVKVHIPNDPITSLGNPPGPILMGDRQDLETLDKKQYVASVAMAASASASIDCKYKYCDGQTQYCMYWAGVTGWNPSLGPVPGMTRTALSGCQVPATEFTTYRSVHTTMAPTKNRVCSTKTSSFRALAV
ncbi:hypothetical protein CGRA01v4_06715 [Colletotrichum graminicola]|uniref:Ig-like domain-containing protein n=1 Tax=Colletotrichum graminicola (strain M1.001 / M2 / FGSC 10212) TaxID=645133 RepID=E3Q316_COLGM|nr:uncharacterized protein GLRG_00139 [Colletotrichum graminicola M1.001]EFQ24995.1 hypothetical protein GLRG_00139 [Colletotrichum graminicola M1.001]WDK15434.1 hypothetical protein CGRA01v4_06715 [Colletotrichum graminicola]